MVGTKVEQRLDKGGWENIYEIQYYGRINTSEHKMCTQIIRSVARAKACSSSLYVMKGVMLLLLKNNDHLLDGKAAVSVDVSMVLLFMTNLSLSSSTLT